MSKHPYLAFLTTVCLLAACDARQDQQAPPTSAPVTPPSKETTTTAPARPETERSKVDARLKSPGHHGGEMYELGAAVASLELVRNVEATPHLEIWIWNPDRTVLMPIPQDMIEVQIAPIERLGEGRPGNFTIQLLADPDWTDPSGHCSHFFANAKRMKFIPTFEMQLGNLVARGQQIGGRSLRYPYRKDRGE